MYFVLGASTVDAIAGRLSGPATLVGDSPFAFGEYGGLGAVWIRSQAGQPGAISLTASNLLLGQAEIQVRSAPASQGEQPASPGGGTDTGGDSDAGGARQHGGTRMLAGYGNMAGHGCWRGTATWRDTDAGGARQLAGTRMLAGRCHHGPFSILIFIF